MRGERLAGFLKAGGQHCRLRDESGDSGESGAAQYVRKYGFCLIIGGVRGCDAVCFALLYEGRENS